MANSVSQSELSKALDELILRENTPPLEKDDVTAPRVMEKSGWNHQRAMQVIKRWEAEGHIKYIGERMDTNGHKCKAWQIVRAAA